MPCNYGSMKPSTKSSKLSEELSHNPKIRNPKALAASIGRKKSAGAKRQPFGTKDRSPKTR